MYRIIHGKTHELPDASEFIDILNNLEQNPVVEARTMFDAHSDIIVSRAPGRLDVMGGIADYSGSLVLEMPIREATFVALQRDPTGAIRIVSLGDDASHSLTFEMSLTDFAGPDQAIEYAAAQTFFQTNAANRWAGYVAGAFLVLMHERGITFQDGARILIASRVPQGKGVSSSAAIEVAVMQAMAAAFGISIDPRELALLCQKVENLVVGAPCGVMDQMTASCGDANRMLAMICQPAELLGTLPVPDEMGVWGLDSGVRHAVSGSDYVSVRTGAFIGYRIIANLAGLEISKSRGGYTVHVDDPRWGGYLSNITPAEFEESFMSRLPETINGGEFLRKYHGTSDPVTRVAPDREYAVRAPTAHPIYENDRVRAFSEILAYSLGEQSMEQLGELMYQSHASYSACGLGSPSTDRLIELVRRAGPRQGLYGAKITGGGSGGTVAVLGRSDAGSAITRLIEEFARETGHQPYVFEGSSPGSAAFGCLRLGRQ